MTVYEKTMQEMTIEKFAVLSVKPTLLDGVDMYYVTSSGQLFPYTAEGRQNAVNYQYQILSQNIIEDKIDNQKENSEKEE